MRNFILTVIAFSTAGATATSELFSLKRGPKDHCAAFALVEQIPGSYPGLRLTEVASMLDIHGRTALIPMEKLNFEHLEMNDHVKITAWRQDDGSYLFQREDIVGARDPSDYGYSTYSSVQVSRDGNSFLVGWSSGANRPGQCLYQK